MKKQDPSSLQTRLAARTGKFLETIPVNKFYEQALWIEQDLLPRIESKSGADSADYKYFLELFKSMTYCIVVLDRFDYLTRKLGQQNQVLSILEERNRLLENELQKYTTLEDLYFRDALEQYSEGIKTRAADLLNKKPNDHGDPGRILHPIREGSSKTA